MDPHYPSTAELAAFRRSYGYTLDCLGHDVTDYERANGIGYREAAPDGMCIVIPDGARHTGAVARERAAAMRHRAYLRQGRAAVGAYHELMLAVDRFAPAWNPYTDGERCGCAGGAFGHVDSCASAR